MVHLLKHKTVRKVYCKWNTRGSISPWNINSNYSICMYRKASKTKEKAWYSATFLQGGLTMLVQADASIMNLGLNPTHWIGPGWLPSNTVSFWPLSEPHTWTRPSWDPVNRHNREAEKCDVTLPWKQNFWLTTKGNLTNDDGDGNKNGKKAIELYY